MAADKKLDLQVVLEGLGQGILIFDSAGKLAHDNMAARTILGTDLNVIRSEGWKAASVLFNTRLMNPDENLDAMKKKALESERPVRFHIFRSGEYVPCWAAAVHGEGDAVYTMITLERQDWTALTELIDRFRTQLNEALESTQGHADLIAQLIANPKPNTTVESLGKRISGFTRLISTHMHRTARLMEMFERLEHIRSGKLNELVRERRRKVDLAGFMEDFVEELDEISLVDPETEAQEYRSRLNTMVAEGLVVSASPAHLTRILHDMLRNAIMYSLKAAPIKITAYAVPANQSVQIDVVDEGYGIRESESDRVFEMFMRARQPQIISEFGYGLSLYLCKHEVEAMNGRMWFKSEEGVGSTVSFMLPVWREDSASSSESQKTN